MRREEAHRGLLEVDCGLGRGRWLYSGAAARVAPLCRARLGAGPRGKGAGRREERCPQSSWGGAGPGISTWPGLGLARCLDAWMMLDAWMPGCLDTWMLPPQAELT